MMACYGMNVRREVLKYMYIPMGIKEEFVRFWIKKQHEEKKIGIKVDCSYHRNEKVSG